LNYILVILISFTVVMVANSTQKIYMCYFEKIFVI